MPTAVITGTVVETNPTSILLPFDEETQKRLLLMDAGCQVLVEQENTEEARCLLSNEPYEPDMETAGFKEFIACYGILMNRAIEAGWIKGVLHEKE